MKFRNVVFLSFFLKILSNDLFSCVTDVDVFTFKNCNIKGIRVVEFDTIQKQFLRISYYYNLAEDVWYSVRTSGRNQQHSILSVKSNGEVILDDNEFVGTLLSSSFIHTHTLLPDPVTYPSSIYYDDSMESKSAHKHRYIVEKKGELYIWGAPVYFYDMAFQNTYSSTMDHLIPDEFVAKCVIRRSAYNTSFMQLRNHTIQATENHLERDGLKLLNYDRNSEKGILGELAVTLCLIGENIKCKLSVKNEDEHHGTYDGAYIPQDTDQPTRLILTESKYKTGDANKLVSRFASDYYSTFQKLLNSQGSNASLKRKTAQIMRYMALHPMQDIWALINIGSPSVQLTYYKVYVDPTPFSYIIYWQPHQNAMHNNTIVSQPIQPGITFENMKKLIDLVYKGRNAKEGESLISVNEWFGFNEKNPSGSHKYVLKKDMTKLTSNQLITIFNHFNNAIRKLLDSNSINDTNKNTIKRIAGM